MKVKIDYIVGKCELCLQDAPACIDVRHINGGHFTLCGSCVAEFMSYMLDTQREYAHIRRRVN